MSQSLWDFAVDRYARPGVAEACLHLQDDWDADVCLLLAGLWLEQRGVTPAAAQVAALRRLAEPWQRTVTAPLRDLRRAWKPLAQDDAALAELRARLAALELQAERLLLQRLAALGEGWPRDGDGDWLQALLPATADAARQRLRTALAAAPQS